VSRLSKVVVDTQTYKHTDASKTSSIHGTRRELLFDIVIGRRTYNSESQVLLWKGLLPDVGSVWTRTSRRLQVYKRVTCSVVGGT